MKQFTAHIKYLSLPLINVYESSVDSTLKVLLNQWRYKLSVLESMLKGIEIDEDKDADINRTFAKFDNLSHEIYKKTYIYEEQDLFYFEGGSKQQTFFNSMLELKNLIITYAKLVGSVITTSLPRKLWEELLVVYVPSVTGNLEYMNSLLSDILEYENVLQPTYTLIRD